MDFVQIIQDGDDIVLDGIRHFDLAQTLDCGQAFRWNGTDKQFAGIAHGRYLHVEKINDGVVLKNMTLFDFEQIWKPYFDLTRNYAELREYFNFCPHLTNAMQFSPGLRLMRQDPWEMLISFILSQNSNIPRIKKMINVLCQLYGEKLSCDTDNHTGAELSTLPVYGTGTYTFPTPTALANITESDLSPVKSGYRAAYIIDAARRVVDGRFNIAELSIKPTEEVKHALLEIHGVGPKVADCVLLFGFGRVECFPLDVWMKKVMTNMYPSGLPNEIKDYAGIAQQFLFHYARTNKAAFAEL